MRALRAPTQLYDRHLRRILGRRYLRLTHTSRTAGRQYQTMLEVVGENPARSPISRLAASSGLRPRLPITAELRFGELRCRVGRRRRSPKALAERLTCAGEQTPSADALVTERAPAAPPSSPLRWTRRESAAFARASTTAPAGEERADGIARTSVVGVELHMHPDVGVCSIRYDELKAVLLLRQQRGYAAQPAPGLWNGRFPELIGRRRRHRRRPSPNRPEREPETAGLRLAGFWIRQERH